MDKQISSSHYIHIPNNVFPRVSWNIWFQTTNQIMIHLKSLVTLGTIPLTGHHLWRGVYRPCSLSKKSSVWWSNKASIVDREEYGVAWQPKSTWGQHSYICFLYNQPNSCIPFVLINPTLWCKNGWEKFPPTAPGKCCFDISWSFCDKCTTKKILRQDQPFSMEFTLRNGVWKWGI